MLLRSCTFLATQHCRWLSSASKASTESLPRTSAITTAATTTSTTTTTQGQAASREAEEGCQGGGAPTTEKVEENGPPQEEASTTAPAAKERFATVFAVHFAQLRFFCAALIHQLTAVNDHQRCHARRLPPLAHGNLHLQWAILSAAVHHHCPPHHRLQKQVPLLLPRALPCLHRPHPSSSSQCNSCLLLSRLLSRSIRIHCV